VAGNLESLLRLLIPNEQRHADTLVRPGERARFIASRAAVRHILAGYTGQEPQDIGFRNGPNGKPFLKGSHADIQFSVSHSENLSLCAVTRSAPIGVDVERIHDGVDPAALAARYFAPVETRELEALPPEEAVCAFYRIWTRKEAVLKAIGAGLAAPLDAFSVSLRPDTQPECVTVTEPDGRSSSWRVQEIPLARPHVAAVAVGERAYTLCLWDWPGTGGS